MSPPLSPVAKSAHFPVLRFIEKEPGRSSARMGFLTTYSSPWRFPPGSHLLSMSGNAAIAAWFTRSNKDMANSQAADGSIGKNCKACPHGDIGQVEIHLGYVLQIYLQTEDSKPVSQYEPAYLRA